MPRPVRRRLQRAMKKSRDVDQIRRAQELLTLHALGGNISAASRVYGASCRVLRQWRILYGRDRSPMLSGWPARHGRVQLLFQPAYRPWANRIERLWKQLHDTVTRNHCYQSLDMLMAAVRRFMRVCQLFPGSTPALVTAS
ncbi:MAG: hypothetical protein NFCOHLIN_02929 [Gammaproteobacteria bacterium]|nr:hypothetical protein [Gammaproteobacteria bacterium]